MRRRRKRTILAVGLVVGLGLVVGCGAGSLDEVTRQVRQRFPAVPQLTTAALAQWLDDAQRPAPVLIDVRQPEEYAVSHLAGAVQVTPGEPLNEALLALERSTPIVAYCSVGYRSSRFVERLQATGFVEVYNLEGSIFAWANEGRPVVRGDRRVNDVHPYDRTWGRLLDATRRAEQSSASPTLP